jgi:hypothetical protein
MHRVIRGWVTLSVFGWLLAAVPARAQQGEPEAEPPPVEAPPPAPPTPVEEPAVPDEPDAPVEPPPPAVPEGRQWFGWQIMLVDLVTAGGGWEAATRLRAPWALATYIVAAPIVHGIHSDPGGFAGSLALHLFAPLAGVLAVASWSHDGCNSDSGGCLNNADKGLLVGALAATAIDAALLSWTDPPPAWRRSRYLALPTISLDPKGGTLTVGLVGHLL